MCLPGTIETVREQTEREGVSRRALLAGGGAAAVAAAIPGAAEARKRRGRRARRARRQAALREGHRPHPPLPRRLPGLHGRRADPPHAQELRPRRLLLAGVDLRRALGHPHGRARALRPGRPPRAAAAPRGAARPGGRHRHLRARRLGPRRRGRAATTCTRYERRHGRIPRGARRAHELGLGRARSTTTRRSRTPTRTAPTTSPASGSTPSRSLLDRRDIQGIGVDTLSLDPGNSTTFAVHNRLLGADRYGIENVANLSALRPHGALRVGRRGAVGGGLRRALPPARLRVSTRELRPLDSQVRLE